jgi:hypothetical protein
MVYIHNTSNAKSTPSSSVDDSYTKHLVVHSIIYAAVGAYNALETVDPGVVIFNLLSDILQIEMRVHLLLGRIPSEAAYNAASQLETGWNPSQI